ncbi:insulin-like growth factor-binding protein complex acid labile subunit [Homarus americanus]|uniref:insulin-like growth factor-binding protein complex acid labile subunit n=1 Tax=Homarus americanus TaxID=6706 RepID=UPI001C4635CF|nr:insulin-like growth factor-binding protein complex acid labile subunit [Homarus americanus]XP_042218090.1 insulin-like growth factor-binding protein complex acid labile subunit [Homarus americanus]
MERDTTPLLLYNNHHPTLSDDSEWDDLLGRGKCESTFPSTPSHSPRNLHRKPLTDHAQGRRKLFAKFGLSAMFSSRDSSNSPKMARQVVKPSETNSSFALPWTRSKVTNKSYITNNDNRRTDGIKSEKSCGQNCQTEEDSPALLTSPDTYRSRRKHRLWFTEPRGYKTVPAETQPVLPGQANSGSSRAWVSPPAWSSVVHGLHSVALVLMVTLLSPVGAFCPRGCSCDDVGLLVHCDKADLDVIPILLHPGTLELHLSHNRIKTILEGLIFYNELRFLDLSHNEVVSLGSQNFASQRSLKTLVINNNKVSKIQSRAFLGLSKLTTLDLSDNYIETLENNAFSSLSKLKTLDLSNNRIKNLTANTFMKLRGLKLLNLCKNELKDISSVVFEPLKELQDLDLCSNQITVIQDFAFKSLKGLINLKLSNNKVRHIHEKAFSGLESLRLLGLKDNAFTEVPSHILPAIKGLEELDLGINPLTSLPFDPFSQLVNLKSLHISRCENLSLIDSGAFASLSKLNSLVLSFNPQLSSLQRDVFKPLTGLRHLVLRGNGLRGFDRSLVSSTSLQSLDLRDNRLECNCSIKWLQEASLNNSLSLKIEEISCAGPDVLRGRSLSELSEYDLECYNNVVVVASCAAASMALILLLVAFGVLYYKNCRKMKAMVHDNWPEKIVATWKDPEYQKQVEDEEYTFHSLRGIQHIPVTVI